MEWITIGETAVVVHVDTCCFEGSNYSELVRCSGGRTVGWDQLGFLGDQEVTWNYHAADKYQKKLLRADISKLVLQVTTQQFFQN